MSVENFDTTTFIVLDFETTGTHAEDSEILEIGAVKVTIEKNGSLTSGETYSTLVRPKESIPLLITQITHISNEMVKDAPPLEKVLPGFLDFLGEFPIVAHNASLELAFLNQHVLPRASVEKFRVFNSIEPFALLLADQPSHSLESLRKWAASLGAPIDSKDAHRALKDCEDVVAILQFAQTWMHKERPLAMQVAGELLTGWWWEWFFKAPELAGAEDLFSNKSSKKSSKKSDGNWAFYREVFDRPQSGDLKELRSLDSDRSTGDWPDRLSKEVPSALIHEKLSKGGELQKGFEYRESQEQMSQSVRESMTKGLRVAIEAPTGTGKSIAYLLPGVLSARSTGAPLVISTHSKALQDQLLEKDIPKLRELLGTSDLKATTVKGQENYVCLRKLHETLGSLGNDAPLAERLALAYIVMLVGVAKSAELDRASYYLKTQYPELEDILARVKSHHTTTQGPKCAFYQSCHYFGAARRAHQSDVVIANHSLVFQWSAQLPQIRNIVFDEAHHLENQITDAFSVELKESELSETLDKFARKPRGRRAPDMAQLALFMNELPFPKQFQDKNLREYLEECAESLHSRLTQLFTILPVVFSRSREQSDGYELFCDAHLMPPTLREGFENLLGSLARLSDLLDLAYAACESAPGGGSNPYKKNPLYDTLANYRERFSEARLALETVIQGSDQGSDIKPDPEENAIPKADYLRLIHWSTSNESWRVTAAPIDVRPLAEPFFAAKRSVVLTSATLSTGRSKTFVMDRMGLKLDREFQSFASPYALEKQSAVFIPRDLAPPGSPSHLEALIAFTEAASRHLGGRTLLLMTSNRRLKHAAEILRDRLKKDSITVFDSVFDRRAAENFRVTDRALLIGGERYGEGLDIPGQRLSLVIVEKINEAMTRGPLAEARKARTQFALFDYDFPMRMMWLKQRVGRLIRSPHDRGAIVVFDSRYWQWGNASKQFVNLALAPMPLHGGSREEVLAAIEAMRLGDLPIENGL